MINSRLITDEEEQALLAEWFASVEFLGEQYQEGELPGLDEEEDDEGRSTGYAIPSTVDTASLLAELRKRDPDNPF
jgi:hypothetical protein